MKDGTKYTGKVSGSIDKELLHQRLCALATRMQLHLLVAQLAGYVADEYADAVRASVHHITESIIGDLEANRTLEEAKAADGGRSKDAAERAIDSLTPRASRFSPPSSNELN